MRKRRNFWLWEKTFKNAAVYIAQRLDSVTKGRAIADALAEEFYDYGLSLETGKRSDVPATIENIASHVLNPEELEDVDRFLAGEHLYRSRRARVKQPSEGELTTKEELYETGRSKTLAQFFKVTQKAFELKQKTESGELKKDTSHLKPWENDAPIHSAFLEKIERALKKEIETPKREFEMAIFRRGLTNLVDEMKESGWKHGLHSFFGKLGLDFRLEQRKITDILNIPQLRTNLENARKSGNAEQISVLEREIADKIQQVVRSFPYQSDGNDPAKMLANQHINCVGASILGGALMKEAGLNYLVGMVPGHSTLLLVTEDGRVEWRDMLSAIGKKELTNTMITGKNKEGSPLTVRDIVALSRNPNQQGLMFYIKSSTYPYKLSWVKKGALSHVSVHQPEYGQQLQVLNNTGTVLSELGHYKEALLAYWKAIAIDRTSAYPYNGLGNMLSYLGNHKIAIVAYRKAIAIDPTSPHPYNGLGNALHELGQHKKALVAYHRFIELADKENDTYFIERAERIIAELQNT